MLLVLTDRFDAHADRVLQEVEARGGVDFFRLDLDVESLEQTFLTFPVGSEDWVIRQHNRQVRRIDVRGVWLRRASIEQSAIAVRSEGVDAATVKIWLGEWRSVLVWVVQSLGRVPWFPPLRESLRAESKLLQARSAFNAGLTMPATLVTNDREAALEFAKGAKYGVAVKSLAQDFFDVEGAKLGLFVNRVDGEDLQCIADGREAPICLQYYQPKAYEVRVTTVGKRHFACRIDSQRSSATEVDWRRYDLPRTPHAAIDLPEEVSNSLSKLLCELGLPFGASDFIVTPSGDWLFLEVNPNGQWLWIQQLVGLPIAQAITDALAELLTFPVTQVETTRKL